MHVALKPDALPEIPIEATLISVASMEVPSPPKPEFKTPLPMQKTAAASPIKVMQKQEQSVQKTAVAEKLNPEETPKEKLVESSKNSAVIEPRFNVEVLNNQPPAYPTSARRMLQEGTVLLRVVVTASGQAGGITIHHSSGFSPLDEAALKAVQQWRFIPARQGTEVVDYPIIVPITFTLSKKQ
jgi:protein TonB